MRPKAALGSIDALRLTHTTEAERIQNELDTLPPGYATDGVVRTVLRERVTQELDRAARIQRLR